MPRLLGRCRPALLLAACLLLAPFETARAQDDPPPRGKGGKGFSKGARPKAELKKYDEVITKEAKSSPGVFLVHCIEDKVYFEVPKDALGKPMLWTIEVAKAPSGLGWGGRSVGNRVVKLERRGNRVYLWGLSFERRADGTAVQRAVDAA